jgi:6-pyruvoyltetrahydropterin/6-carboxytetrahydropterin synthase
VTNLSCTRRLEFDYGHRLLTHEGKCAHVHGHRAVVEIECYAALDAVGRVIDFAEVKRMVGGWIDAEWDHAFIVGEDDEVMRAFLAGHAQRHFVLPGVEPTAEHLAHYLALKSQSLLAPAGIQVTRVRLYETPNGWAEWKP